MHSQQLAADYAATMPGVDDFGARLKKLREARQLNQSDLAGASSANYISRIERGAADPSLKILKRIAKGFGLSLSALFLQLESDLTGHSEGTQSALPRHPAGGDTDGRRAALGTGRKQASELGQALADAAEALIAAADHADTLAGTNRRIYRDRPRKSKSR